jgi:starch synthase
MKILFASAEVSPFAKVGGLGDVAGSLPKAVQEKGHDIKVIMPLYGLIDQEKYNITNVPNSSISINVDNRKIFVSLKHCKLPNSDVSVYFVDNAEYFGYHHDVYPKNTHWDFEQRRFIVFSKAILELLMIIGFKPDIIHCNDWHTASIPVFLKEHYSISGFHRDIKTVFSIHNLAYQGRFGQEILDFAKLPRRLGLSPDKLEYYGDINWMKGAIIYSDKINTVSEKYAAEIQTPEYGEGLDGLLRSKSYKLSGILNGLDYSVWDPQTNKNIVSNYSSKSLSGKKECKKALQQEYNLKIDNDKPVIGLVSRLVNQKGLDLIAGVADELLKTDLQLIVLGSGDWYYENMFRELSARSDNIRATVGFHSALAERIYSGCDMFLMPSRFEPCGLGQLISLRYGTIPIVRATGGLADTVNESNGFVFNNYNCEELMGAIKKALEVYKNKKEWLKLIKTAMKADHSWEKSANKYIAIYNELTI